MMYDLKYHWRMRRRDSVLRERERERRERERERERALIKI